MVLENIHLVAALGFLVALIFGAVANKTNFCAMGSLSDWINMGSTGRLGSWVLAMGIAIAGTQILELTGLVDISSSIYRTANFQWGGYVIGGLLFGIGMTLAGGCGQRNLVRFGGGSLKALVVLLVLGLTAYMTLRGILSLVRLNIVEPLTIDMSTYAQEDHGLATVLASAAGIDASDSMRWLIAGAVSLALIFWAWKQAALREDTDNLLGGVVVGLVVVAAWFITGVIGADDFDPVPVEGMTFVAPTGNSLSFLMTYTGATISFGVAVSFGVIVGSFLYALFTGSFLIETFTQKADMINHLVGGALMGFGGVLSVGCTIGQGVSGLSTLAIGSFVAVLFIVLGSLITMRVRYHRMDDMSTGSAIVAGVADVVLPWRSLD